MSCRYVIVVTAIIATLLLKMLSIRENAGAGGGGGGGLQLATPPFVQNPFFFARNFRGFWRLLPPPPFVQKCFFFPHAVVS